MVVKNYMENVVDDILDDIMPLLHSCKCERCLSDIKAIALNNLPPKYTSTTRGEMFMSVTRLTRQYRVDVMAALYEAEKLVAKNPHRGETQVQDDDKDDKDDNEEVSGE